MISEFEITGRRIGAHHPPYVICELSGNHNGSPERALAMIDAAAATGCDPAQHRQPGLMRLLRP
jgi:sialic acid synthase SpsE